MIRVVGIGPGSREYILPAAVDSLKKSSLIVGFKRALDSLNFIHTEKVYVKSLKEMVEICESHKGDIAVAVSGDPCFYGAAEYLRKNLLEDIEIVPGLSSFQYLACKVGVQWSGGVPSSMHGRENDFLYTVSENPISFWLTGKKNTPQELCKRLYDSGVHRSVIVGENLSYEDEKITCGSPKELMEMEFSSLSVVVVKE